jgi:hypothetical protein
MSTDARAEMDPLLRQQFQQLLASERVLKDKMQQKEHVGVWDPPRNIGLEKECIQLRSLYEKVLFLDLEFATAKELEHSLWKTVFYKRIEHFRKRIRKCAAEAGSRGKNNDDKTSHQLLHEVCFQFSAFISDASVFYGGLLKRFQTFYESLLRSASGADGIVRCAKQSCYRCLVFLGDLARYKELHSENERKDWSHAENFYYKALEVVPSNGNPHNQLAVLATYIDAECVAIYRYARSLLVFQPFVTAKANLVLLFEKNRQRVQKMLQIIPDFLAHSQFRKQGNENGHMRQQQNVMKNKDKSAAFKSYLQRFVRLHGILYSSQSEEHLFDPLRRSIGEDLRGLMQASAVNDGLMLKLVVICIFSISCALGETDGAAFQQSKPKRRKSGDEKDVPDDDDGTTAAEDSQEWSKTDLVCCSVVTLLDLIKHAMEFAISSLKRRDTNGTSRGGGAPPPPAVKFAGPISVGMEWVSSHISVFHDLLLQRRTMEEGTAVLQGSSRLLNSLVEIQAFVALQANFIQTVQHSGAASEVWSPNPPLALTAAGKKEKKEETLFTLRLWLKEELELQGFLPLQNAYREYTLASSKGLLNDAKATVTRMRKMVHASELLASVFLDVKNLRTTGKYPPQGKAEAAPVCGASSSSVSGEFQLLDGVVNALGKTVAEGSTPAPAPAPAPSSKWGPKHPLHHDSKRKEQEQSRKSSHEAKDSSGGGGAGAAAAAARGQLSILKNTNDSRKAKHDSDVVAYSGIVTTTQHPSALPKEQWDDAADPTAGGGEYEEDGTWGGDDDEDMYYHHHDDTGMSSETMRMDIPSSHSFRPSFSQSPSSTDVAHFSYLESERVSIFDGGVQLKFGESAEPMFDSLLSTRTRTAAASDPSDDFESTALGGVLSETPPLWMQTNASDMALNSTDYLKSISDFTRSSLASLRQAPAAAKTMAPHSLSMHFDQFGLNHRAHFTPGQTMVGLDELGVHLRGMASTLPPASNEFDHLLGDLGDTDAIHTDHSETRHFHHVGTFGQAGSYGSRSVNNDGREILNEVSGLAPPAAMPLGRSRDFAQVPVTQPRNPLEAFMAAVQGDGDPSSDSSFAFGGQTFPELENVERESEDLSHFRANILDIVGLKKGTSIT